MSHEDRVVKFQDHTIKHSDISSVQVKFSVFWQAAVPMFFALVFTTLGYIQAKGVSFRRPTSGSEFVAEGGLWIVVSLIFWAWLIGNLVGKSGVSHRVLVTLGSGRVLYSEHMSKSDATERAERILR